MLQPFLVVGVGGSGGKTVRALRHTINLTLRRVGWEDGMPDAWQFLHYDSPQAQDGQSFSAPFLPREDYLSLVPGGVDYSGIFDVVKSKANPKHLAQVERVLPDPGQAGIAIGIGAGQFRGIGKAIAYSSLDQMSAHASIAIGKMKSNRAKSQLSEIDNLFGGAGGPVGAPVLVIVSSIAGGSGAGQFVEVTEAIKCAIGPEAWANEAVSVLYAPDVFDGLGAMGSAVAPNSLYALAETMNAIWTQSPTESIASIYKNQGLILGSSPSYRIGAKYNHIIGRTSNTVNLGGPDDVFKAVGDFMGSWITNPGLQDDLNVGYFGNWLSRALKVPDNTQLKMPAVDPTPFSSFGYGKVSLGLDQFENYSAERISRSVIHNLLNRHLSMDPGCNQKSESEWIESSAKEARDDFFADTKLFKQKSASGFDLYFDLNPDPAQVSVLEAELRNFTMQMATSGNPNAEHSPAAWVEIVHNSLNNLKPQLLEKFSQLVAAKIKETWVPIAPSRMVGVLGLAMSQHGLPVTVEMLSQLRKLNLETVAQFRSMAASYRAVESTASARMAAAIAPAQSMQKVSIANPAVQACIGESDEVLKNLFYAAVFEASAVLLEDFSANFVAPVLQSLESMKVKLTEAAKDPQLPDGRANPYFTWALENSPTPSRFKPAPNVALLIDHAEYPVEFQRLTRDTFGESANPEQTILDEICMGSDNIKGVSIDPNHSWSLFTTGKVWVPSERAYQINQSAPQRATFSTTDDVLSFFDIAKDWLEISGRPFRAFFSLSLAEFLEANGDPLIQAGRHADFVRGFGKAAASSEPLVKLNETLLQATHGVNANTQHVVVSDIPIANGTPLFTQLQNVLQNNGLWGQNSASWFKGPNSPGSAVTTEVFVVKLLAFPVHPIAMGSVVSPIASEWLQASNLPVSRKTFMQWRQGRSLVESIPASPKVWRQMLRGWHIARLMNLLREDRGSQAEFLAKGPRLSLWIDGGENHVDFPYPLFSESTAKLIDYPAVILQSLKVALLNCYAASSLGPLSPYRKLELLGQDGVGTDVAPEVSNWLQYGSLEQGQPTPLPERAGTLQDSFESRKALAITFLEGELASFKASMGELDKFADSRTYPLVWEVREDLEQSLMESIKLVRNLRGGSSL